MKLKIFVLLFYIVVNQFGISQTRKSIDIINSISHQEKIQKSDELDDEFIKNAIDAKKIMYPLGEAESYCNLSLIYYYQGKYEKDLFYSLKAISILEKIDSKERLAIEYGELGYRLKKRDIKKGLKYMQKGMQIAEKNTLQKPLLSIYNNYGVLKEMQNQLDSALYFYNKGLQLKEKTNDVFGMPYSLNNIAGIYFLRKQYDTAKLYYEKALNIRKTLKDEIGISENLSYFGDLYLAQKEYSKAIDFYQKTNQNALKYNYIDLAQYSFKKLSECYELKGNVNLALENFKNYSKFKDSLLNKETNSKIAELEIKYETNKKEKLLLEKEVETKRKNVIIGTISLLAIFIGLIGYLIYRQQKIKNKQQEQEFELKSAISKIETQNKLQEQRLSISRDLHDNIGSQLTFIISSVDNIKYAFDLNNAKLDNKLSNISEFAKSTIVELRDTIWAMNTNEFTFEDLRSRIFNFIEKAKSAKEEVDFKFNVDNSLKDEKFTSIIGINLYRTIQEAVNNGIKYAEAKQIEVTILQQNNQIKIEIKDNGKGFDIETINFGNGLHNMKKRIEEIKGEILITSQIDKGTKVTLKINR